MRKTFTSKRFYIILGALILLGILGKIYAADLRTPFNIAIKMDKKVYAEGEPLIGKVTVENTSMATLPGGFEVKLFQGGNLRHASTVFIETVFSGATDFQFRSFGIPTLQTGTSIPGQWRLVVHPLNHEEKSAGQNFLIESRTN